MTTITHRLGTETLTAGRLPRATVPVAVVASVVLGYALAVLASGAGNIGLATLFAFLLFLVTIEIATRVVEGSRQAADRRASNLIAGAFLLALVPLGSLTWVTLSNGLARFDLAFFSQSMRNVVGEGGGAIHAVYGTLYVTGMATADLGADRPADRHLPRRVRRPESAVEVDHLLRRRDDRRAIDRGRPLRLRPVRPPVRPGHHGRASPAASRSPS